MIKHIILAGVVITASIAMSFRGAVGENNAAGVPTIEGYGSVVAYPAAVEQPREDSRIVVDLTSGGRRDEMNSGIKKLARFVNIYTSAGKEPVRVKIVALLHGDATACALSDEHYAVAFKTNSNPNLPLIRKLREAGVEILVCGQAVVRKGYKAEQVAREVAVAVSGLTAIVNRQQDGYAYFPVN